MKARTTREGQTPAPPSRLGWLAIAAAVCLPAFVFLPGAKDPFDLPKLLVAESAGLLSVVVLLLRPPPARTVAAWVKSDAMRFFGPLWLAASVGWLASSHREHLAAAWWSLTIAVVCGLVWSLSRTDLRRVLDLLVVPGVVLAVLALLEFLELFDPLGVEGRGERMQTTSLAGNVGDLGAFLVFPLLVSVSKLLRPGLVANKQAWIARWGLAVGLVAVGLLLTQSITAILSALAGLLVLLFHNSDSRRKLAIAVFALAGLLGFTVVAIEPIRERVSTRAEALAAGDLNEVLTGRLDGWRVALWMAAKRPLVGVGLGGYAAEFNVGKLELIERGVPFWRKHGVYGTFGNAHNEYLEVFSELGLVGVMALVWGAVVLWRRLRQGPRDRSVRGLGWALTASILVLSLSYFPFRSALVGYPCLASLAWLMSKDWEARSR